MLDTLLSDSIKLMLKRDSGQERSTAQSQRVRRKATSLPHSPYVGPAVFGYETDMPLRRAAQISVHTSPLATLGGKDAGG